MNSQLTRRAFIAFNAGFLVSSPFFAKAQGPYGLVHNAVVDHWQYVREATNDRKIYCFAKNCELKVLLRNALHLADFIEGAYERSIQNPDCRTLDRQIPLLFVQHWLPQLSEPFEHIPCANFTIELLAGLHQGHWSLYFVTREMTFKMKDEDLQTLADKLGVPKTDLIDEQHNFDVDNFRSRVEGMMEEAAFLKLDRSHPNEAVVNLIRQR